MSNCVQNSDGARESLSRSAYINPKNVVSNLLSSMYKALFTLNVGVYVNVNVCEKHSDDVMADVDAKKSISQK